MDRPVERTFHNHTGSVTYWRPNAMPDLVAGYFRYVQPPSAGGAFREALLPGWPKLYLISGESPSARMSIRQRIVDPLPGLGFVGATSFASYLTYGGGTVVGVSLLPKGWARLFGGDLSRMTNRVVPLEQIAPSAPEMIDDGDGDAGRSPVAIFEPWLLTRQGSPSAVEEKLDQLLKLLDSTPTPTALEMSALLELAPNQLARLCVENFGLTPKRVILRQRFVRVMERILSDPDRSGRTLWEAGYIDRSHFAKDCHKFLGCSLHEFRNRRGPINRDALTLRRHEGLPALI